VLYVINCVVTKCIFKCVELLCIKRAYHKDLKMSTTQTHKVTHSPESIMTY